MLLLNRQTNKLENVPENQVEQAILSGSYMGRKGVKVPLFAPDGSIETVPIETATDRIKYDMYRYADLDTVNRFMSDDLDEDLEQIYDKPLVSAAMGAASVGSLGLSDVAIRTAGVADEAARVKEQSPMANLAGQALGIIAPGGVAGAVGKTASNIGARVTAKPIGQAITAGAVEGGVYGVQNVISNAAIYGDNYTNAQNILTDLGLGVVFGGAGGLLGKGIEAGYSRLVKKIDDAATPMLAKQAQEAADFSAKVSKAQKDIEINTILKEAGVPDSSMSKAASVVKNDDVLYNNLLTNKKSKDFTNYLIKEADLPADDALKLTKNPSVIKDVLLDPDLVIKNSAVAVREMKQALKAVGKDAMDFRNLQRADVKIPENVTIGKLENTIKYLDREMTKSYNKMTGTKKGLYEAQRSETLAAVRNRFREEVSAAKTPPELHEVIERARMSFDDVAFPPGTAREVRDLTKQEFRGLRDKFADHLKNQKYYGEYAPIYDTMNSIYNRTTELNKKVTEQFLPRSGDINKLSSSKVAKFLKEGNKNFVNEGNKIIQDFKKIKNDIPDKLVFEEISSKVKRLQSTIDNLEQYQLAVQVNKNFSQKMKNALPYKMDLNIPEAKIPTSSKWYEADMQDIAAGAFFGAEGLIYSLIRRVIKTDAITKKKFVDSLNGFLGKKSVKTIRSGINRSALESIMNLFSNQGLETSDMRNESDLGIARDRLNNHSYATGLILDKLDNNIPEIAGLNPELYAELHNKLLDTSMFLASKLPNVQADTVFKPQYKLSKSDRTRFESYVTAALNPGIFFDELATGKVNPETLETITALYPSIYDRTKEELVTQLAEITDLPYSRKLAIARLFNLPTIPALEYMPTLQGLSNTPGVSTAQQFQSRIKAMNDKTIDAHRTDLQKIS